MKQEWQPNRKSDIPIYIQIKEYIKEKIAIGEWPIGTRLPSQRKLALLFNVNRSTVVEAYEELIAEGLVEGIEGKETKVINNTWNIVASATPDWESYVKGSVYKPNKVFIQRINEAEFLGETIRMGTGELSPQLLPVKKTNQILSSLTVSSDHLGYEETKGSYALRNAICAHVRKFGVIASPSSVLIVSGALQAFQLIANGLLKENSSILVESPSYLFSLNVFQSAKMNLIDVPISKIKNQVSVLKTLKDQHQANLLYTIPTFHNPTGMTYSLEERRGIVDICRSNQLPMIEDDVYRELWIDSPPPKAMKSMDQTGNVLYIGSASKVISPGLRIGWIVGPEMVINQLADLKMQTDYGASSLSQTVLDKWLTNEDMYGEHVHHIRSELKKRRDFMIELLEKYFSGFASWKVPTGSFYVWVQFKESISLSQLFDLALKQHILINPGTVYQENGPSFIRLSYSYESFEKMEYGIKSLAEIIDRIR